MARLIYSRRALNDLERLTDFLLEAEPHSAPETTELVLEAVQVLANHPLAGRPVEQGMREMVISRGRTGYLVLYSDEEQLDTVLILAIRHQCVAGYLRE